MESLFEKVRTAEVEAKAEARRLYVEILQRADRPHRGDDQKLLQVMAALGIDSTWLEHDRDVLRQASDLADQAADDTDELAEAIEAAGRAWTDHQAETRRIVQARQAEESGLHLEFHALQQRRNRARDAGNKLGALKRKHHALFGVAPAAPEPEPRPVCSPTPAPDPAAVEAENASVPVGLPWVPGGDNPNWVGKHEAEAAAARMNAPRGQGRPAAVAVAEGTPGA